MGRADRRARATATRPRCSPGWPRTDSRSRSGFRRFPSRRWSGSRSVTGPAGLPLTEGRACLTAHAHAPDFTWQENFQVRGDLVREGESWALVPHKLVGGMELPKESNLARLRRGMAHSFRYWRRAREERERRSG